MTHIGNSPDWQFMGRRLKLKPDYKGVTMQYLSQMIDVPLDFLVGMDVLKELYYAILDTELFDQYIATFDQGSRNMRLEAYPR